jgi:hypothetical protein
MQTSMVEKYMNEDPGKTPKQNPNEEPGACTDDTTHPLRRVR